MKQVKRGFNVIVVLTVLMSLMSFVSFGAITADVTDVSVVSATVEWSADGGSDYYMYSIDGSGVLPIAIGTPIVVTGAMGSSHSVVITGYIEGEPEQVYRVENVPDGSDELYYRMYPNPDGSWHNAYFDPADVIIMSSVPSSWVYVGEHTQSGREYSWGVWNTGTVEEMNIITNETITVNVQLLSGYQVTTTQNIPEAGATSPSSVEVAPGDSATVSASAASGYEFIKWNIIVGGVGSYYSDSETLTVRPTGDITLEAVFAADETIITLPSPIVEEEEPVVEEPVVEEPVVEEPVVEEPVVEEPVVEEPVVEEPVVDEETVPEDVPEEILDEEIPEDVPMPQTAGIPMEVASLFGGSLVALGTVIKRKRTK